MSPVERVVRNYLDSLSLWERTVTCFAAVLAVGVAAGLLSYLLLGDDALRLPIVAGAVVGFCLIEGPALDRWRRRGR